MRQLDHSARSTGVDSFPGWGGEGHFPSQAQNGIDDRPSKSVNKAQSVVLDDDNNNVVISCKLYIILLSSFLLCFS